MSYTKGELVEMAMEEIGIASYEFDISPEQITTALRRLNSMMAEWNARGITLPFPISKPGDSSLEESNIPDWAIEATITNLGIRLAPSYGKTISMETRITAKQAYTTMCSIFAKPKESQLPSMPKGAGYKSTGSPYTPAPVEQYLESIDDEFNPSKGIPDE